MDNTGELLITILSSQAQEESRNISENIRWGIKRRFENGIVNMNTKNILGYTKDSKNQIIIDEEQAKIVRRIYREYLEGKGYLKIAKGLIKDKIKTITGKDKWSTSSVTLILANEKYIGDAMLQKTYTKDFLNKKRMKNKGNVTSYYVENNHKAIIPKEIFNRVQEEKARRSNIRKKENIRETTKSKYSSKYVLTEILKCGECGRQYRRQSWVKEGKKSGVWRCEDRLKNGRKSECKYSPTLKEKDLQQIIMRAINERLENKKDIKKQIEDNINSVVDKNANYDYEIGKLQQRLLKMVEKQAKNGIEDIDDKCIQIANEIKDIKSQKLEIENQNKVSINMKNIIENADIIEYNENVVKKIIKEIKVYKNNDIKIKFKNESITIDDINKFGY